MHEVSLVIGLARQLEAIAKEHGATAVRRFELEVGAMSNVVPELLRDAIAVVREDVPVIADAEFTVHEVALRLSCRECGAVTEPESFSFGCPNCGSPAVNVERGEELLLLQVELELPDLPEVEMNVDEGADHDE